MWTYIHCEILASYIKYFSRFLFSLSGSPSFSRNPQNKLHKAICHIIVPLFHCGFRIWCPFLSNNGQCNNNSFKNKNPYTHKCSFNRLSRVFCSSIHFSLCLEVATFSCLLLLLWQKVATITNVDLYITVFFKKTSVCLWLLTGG